MANYHKGFWLFTGILYVFGFLAALYMEKWLWAIITFLVGSWTLGLIFDSKLKLPETEFQIINPNEKEKVRKL
jgi:hypothetical protein